ncbi:hypothetical protein LCGC14_1839500 [marine sediment metagenome]|uniref:SprT-like domain-containing protein n=1 Tax=marine sediment metagenome TaxID=412755 RepID=A0A0F9H1V0_9ZZZZ
MPVDELTLHRRALKKEACKILGIDRRKVRLRRLTNIERAMAGPGRLFGVADPATKTIRTRGRTGLVTYVHELLHLLYRSKTHWWVFGAAYILAGRPRRAMIQSVLAAADIPQSKAQLRRLVRAQAERVGLA